MTVTSTRRLLPHERWLAAAVLERQRVHRTRSVLYTEQNYGHDGIVLFAACGATALLGEPLIFIGILLVVCYSGSAAVTTLSLGLVFLGSALIVAGLVRVVQGVQACRAFRSGNA